MRPERRIAFLFILVLSVPVALSRGGQEAGKAEDAALLKLAREDLGRLPSVIAAADNPVTPVKIALGKMLFYDTRFSEDGTVSCVRCHPFSLYGADGLRRSVGAGGKPAARNAPTVLNAAGQISAHWVGNRKDVEDQATQSLIGNAAPGAPSADAATRGLQKIAAYGPIFRDAFPGEKDPVNVVNYGRAIGAFERTLVTPSAFDGFLDGNVKALADAQKRGLTRFIETGCVQCHSGVYVGGQTYEMFGVREPYWTYTKSPNLDEGRFAVTKNPDDKYVFKVPGLRNVAMTPPYFHDGSVERLSEAVRIMGKVQLGMSLAAPEAESIVAFLESLTGEIPADALRVPILPRRG